MCYPKPGPRCSNHAKAALFEAKKTFVEASETDDAVLTSSARSNYHVATRRYDATPDGQRRLQRQLRKKNLDDLTRRKIERRLMYAQRARAAQLEAYKMSKNVGKEQIGKVRDAHEMACALSFAESYARYQHRGQYRKDGTEYVEHPIRVAEYVKKYGGSREQIIAAYLHDTVEDTDATLPQIRKSFGDEVADMVDALSHREGETYRESITRLIRTCPQAILVKIGDNSDNSDENQLKVFRSNFSDYMRRVNKYERARRELIRAHYQVRGYEVVG